MQVVKPKMTANAVAPLPDLDDLMLGLLAAVSFGRMLLMKSQPLSSLEEMSMLASHRAALLYKSRHDSDAWAACSSPLLFSSAGSKQSWQLESTMEVLAYGSSYPLMVAQAALSPRVLQYASEKTPR